MRQSDPRLAEAITDKEKESLFIQEIRRNACWFSKTLLLCVTAKDTMLKERTFLSKTLFEIGASSYRP